LVNPSFEQAGENTIPQGWILGHLGYPPWEPGKPFLTCNEAAISNQPQPEWLRSGERNLALWLGDCTSAGIKQIVNVVPGTTYRFGVWGKIWSSTGQDRTVSIEPAPMDIWVCIGTHGSRDDISNPEVNVCSAPARPYDTWQYFSVDAVAQEEQIVVRVLAQHNSGEPGVALWDDASLTVATVAATPTPVPAAAARPTRPGPVPFDAHALHNAMLQAQSDMVQMGGLLDRLMDGGREECEPYIGWYDSLVASPMYDSVPPEWGGVYGEYVWAVERVLDSSHTVDFICSGEGGVLTNLDYGVARGGIIETV
jgi:hypothetical protein